MTQFYFICGLSCFALGLVALVERRRDSTLALGQHLHWLGGFALLHSVVAWSRLSGELVPSETIRLLNNFVTFFIAPVAALLLVRFGVGLVVDSGPLPSWLRFAPMVVIPMVLVFAHAIVVVVTATDPAVAIDAWTRYLLFLPGALLAAIGFWRQWRRMQHLRAFSLLLLPAVSVVFLLNGVLYGIFVPESDHGLARWINENWATAVIGVNLDAWRIVGVLLMTILIIAAMDVFEVERRHHLTTLEAERIRAHRVATDIRHKARQSAEVWLNALVNISRRIANMDDVDEVLLHIVDQARQLTSADAASLGLLQASGQLRRQFYADASGAHQLSDDVVNAPLVVRAMAERRSLRYPQDAPPDPPTWTCTVSGQTVSAAAVVPLVLDQSVIGVQWVKTFDDVSFTAADVEDLEHLADQSVIALEHATMAARLQSVAVIEERSRIAREMHDSLAQILGYLGLELQTLEALARQGATEQLLEQLQSARKTIKSAQADVRENILSLRTTLAGDKGLYAALQEYVDEFGVQTGIRARLSHPAGAPPPLAPLAEAQLVRIVQEALTNVRKHADAHSVNVNLSLQVDRLRVQIVDDGAGFDPEKSAGNRHFGLQTMRERAESAGGVLVVHSHKGEGTRVELVLPFVTISQSNGQSADL